MVYEILPSIFQVGQKEIKDLRDKLTLTLKELQQFKMNMIEISEEAHV